MLNGGFANLPPDSWKPFGNGIRGCIGRPFAWQESRLVIAMVRPINFECRLYTDEADLPELRHEIAQPQLSAQDQANSYRQTR
jgi:hypothetical protein